MDSRGDNSLSVYNLLRGDDYNNLPDTKELIFTHLEEIARERLSQIVNTTDDQNYYNSHIRSQYIGEIQGLATGLGIEIHAAVSDVENSAEFDIFLRDISNLSVRLRLQSSLGNTTDELKLSHPTTMRIKHLLQKLKDEINQGDIDDRKKNRLLSKIQKLEEDLSANRTNLSAVMIVVATVVVAVGGGTEFLANVPDALKTIGQIIEHIGEESDKADDFTESLEAEQKRIRTPLPQPALPAPPKVAIENKQPADDDIPF